MKQSLPLQPLNTIEWVGLVWGVITFLVSTVMALAVAPGVLRSLQDLIAELPLMTRVVLHPAWVLGCGVVPLFVSALAIALRWSPPIRTVVILGGAAASLIFAGAAVIGLYLPLFQMAGRAGA